MRNICLAILGLCLAASAAAAPTEIKDTLYFPDGMPYTGTLYISWTAAFIAPDGHRIGPPAVPIQVNITAGALDVFLEPTTTSTPIVPGRPLFYSVRSAPISAMAQPQVWVVPPSATALNLAAVEASQPPANSQISPLQINTFGATSGQCLVFTDGSVQWGTCGSFTGIESLNGLSGNNQTLAPASDANVTLSITPSGSTNTFAMGWSGQLSVGRGGTGAASITGLVKGNGSSAFSSAIAGTDYLPPAALSGLTSIGAVPYVSATSTLAQDASAFVYDAVNKGLCVGCSSGLNATTKMIVSSSGNAQANISAGSGSHYSLLDLISGGGGSSTDHSILQWANPSGPLWLATSPWNGNTNWALRDGSTLNPRIVFAKSTGDVLITGSETDNGYRFELGYSGSAGTERIFDQSASSNTQIVWRMGQSQATSFVDLLTIQNYSGTRLSGIASDGSIYSYSSVLGGRTALMADDFVGTGANGYMGFGSAANYDAGGCDTAFHRNAPGLAEVDNCNASVYRDLIVRYPIWTATTTNDSELNNSQCTFWLESDVSPDVRCRGSDGVVRNWSLPSGGGGGSGTPGGSTYAVQYNAGSGAFGGITLNTTTQRKFVMQVGDGSSAMAPTLDTVALGTDVTGTLSVGHGGTGQTTLTAHGVLVGNTTSGINATTAGTTGYPLVSNGPSADPTFQRLALGTGVTGTLPAANGGTGGDSSAATGVAQVTAGTWSYSALALSKLATQAADTVLLNATGGSAVPTAVAMPTTGTNGCAGTSDALIYNTTTHALGCNTITGGGTADPGAVHSVAFSATPTLTGSSATGGTVDTFVVGQLSANITSITLATLTPGQIINLDFRQASSGGPYTITYGASFVGTCGASPIAGAHTKSTWYITTGPVATLTAGGCVSDSGVSFLTETSAPSTPPSGLQAFYGDSTAHFPRAIDSSGNGYGMSKDLTSGQLRVAGGAAAADTGLTPGTGVLTALAASVSGSGSICLSSGSLCSSGGGGYDPTDFSTFAEGYDLGQITGQYSQTYFYNWNGTCVTTAGWTSSAAGETLLTEGNVSGCYFGRAGSPFKDFISGGSPLNYTTDLRYGTVSGTGTQTILAWASARYDSFNPASNSYVGIRYNNSTGHHECVIVNGGTDVASTNIGDTPDNNVHTFKVTNGGSSNSVTCSVGAMSVTTTGTIPSGNWYLITGGTSAGSTTFAVGRIAIKIAGTPN